MALLKIEEMLKAIWLRLPAQDQRCLCLQAAHSGSGIPVGDYIAPVAKDVAAKASVSSILEYAGMQLYRHVLTLLQTFAISKTQLMEAGFTTVYG